QTIENLSTLYLHDALPIYWRITWRIKDLIILNSGHNIAPEPVEEKLWTLIPQAQQILLAGDGRGYLCALVTGDVDSRDVQAALEDRKSTRLNSSHGRLSYA